MRTAESVVLTPWPPGPDERYTSTLMSLSSTFTSTSSASGRTATVTVEVWMRPADSVAGTRWTRCTPRSNLSRLQAPLPWTDRMTSLKPPWPVGWAVEHLELEPVALGVLRVHAGEVGGEERGLVPAGARPDLDEDVLVVAGVPGHQHRPQALLEVPLAHAELLELQARQLVELRVAVFAEDVVGLLDAGENALVLPERGHDGLDLRRRLGEPRVLRASAGRVGGLGEAGGELLVAALDLPELIEHDPRSGPRGSHARAWPRAEGGG